MNSARSRWYSSRSNVASWIGVSVSIQNGFLPFLLLVVLEAHVDLRPDAAGEQAVVVAHVAVGDVDVLVAEVGDLGPVARIDQPHLHLVDEGVPALLLDLALRLRRLVGADVVVGQRLVDDLHPHPDRHLVGRGAVLPEEVLEHEDGDVRPDLHLADEVLADDLAREDASHLVVELVADGDLLFGDPHIPSLTGISSDCPNTASVAGS